MRTCAVFLMMAAVMGVTQAQPLDYKGVSFGADKDALREAFEQGTIFTCSTVENDEECTMDRTTYAGVQVPQATVNFLNGGFSAIKVTFDPRGFEIVAEALVGKYGKPTSDTRSTVRNRLGAAFQQRELVWRRPDGLLTAARYSVNLDAGHVIIESNVYLAHMKNKLNEMTKKSKKDI